MKIPVDKILARAEDTLSDATFNFESERYEASINRAYYAVFYCLSALLEVQSVSPKTHQGSHKKFNELYIKTGLFPARLNTALDVVFSLRQSGDYDIGFEPTENEARAAIEHASDFLIATKLYFGAQN